MKALITLFSLLLILLLAGLWVGSGNYLEHWELESKILEQESANKARKLEIKRLQAELDDIKSGHTAIEERARSDFGMTAKGETFFKVILQPDAPKVTDLKKEKKEEVKQASDIAPNE